MIFLQQMLKTHERNEARSILEGLIGELKFRARLAFDERSLEYLKFQFTRMSHLKDPEMIHYTRNVLDNARELLDRLTQRGVDQTLLDRIASASEAFDRAIDAQVLATRTREHKRLERIIAANGLYELIAGICEVGKRIWENKNPALYNDYVLYGSRKPKDVQAREEEVHEEEPTEN